MEFLAFAIFVTVSTALGLFLMTVSNFLGVKKKIIRTNDIYESGVNPVGSATRQYDVKFYLTAILFLLFDVEIVFLLPWALAYNNSTHTSFLMGGFIFFMVVLLVGYIFVINSKSLNWEK
jgi:NADH-quinone oxidoreductase subunit A